MKVTITDRIAPEISNKKPIKLIGCLQSYLSNGCFSFGTEKERGEFSEWKAPMSLSSIERVFSQKIGEEQERYDIMILSVEDRKFLFIGEWNDGVWKE